MRKVNVGPSKRFFTLGETIYVVPTSEINLPFEYGKIKKAKTELYYLEGIPPPLSNDNLENLADNSEQGENYQFMEDTIFKNFIRQMSGAKFPNFLRLMEFFRDTFSSPASIFFLLIAGVVLYTILSGGKPF